MLALILAMLSGISGAGQPDEMARSEALNSQALGLYKAGDLQGAIGLWKQAERLAVSRDTGLTANAEVLNNLGFAYYKLGMASSDRSQLQLARAYLANTIQVDPDRWVAYLNIADTYMALQMPAEALYGYRELLRLKPDHPHADKVRAVIQALQTRQDANWKTYHGHGFHLCYPGDYRVGGTGDGGMEFMPPGGDQNCLPHCPKFLIMYTASTGGRTLEEWLLERWRFEGLEDFHLFTITPRQSRYNIDCLESVKLGDGLIGYKLHYWIQAVGSRHYYVKQDDQVVEFVSAGTGLLCEDHLPKDWILKQILESFAFDTPGPRGEGFQIYGGDAQGMDLVVRAVIPLPVATGMPARVQSLADALSKRNFRGLPIVLIDLTKQNGKLIAHIDLREGKTLQQTDVLNSWAQNFFQGTAGGRVTSQALIKTFLQEEYRGEWIDGVVFSYQGRPIMESEFEHMVGLQGIHMRKPAS